MIYLLDTHALWHHASDGDELSPLAATRLDEARLDDLCILRTSQLNNRCFAGKKMEPNLEFAGAVYHRMNRGNYRISTFAYETPTRSERNLEKEGQSVGLYGERKGNG